MVLLVVNFHYLGNEIYPNGGIYPVGLSNFSKQLDILGKSFKFVSLNQILTAVQGNGLLPEKSCLITFDDGLKCQYEKALPILRKKNIPAVFFVIPKTLMEKKVCNVHKVHMLRASIEPERFRKHVNFFLGDLFGTSLEELLVGKEQHPVQKYRYDEPEQAEVKYILNNILDETQKDLLIGKLFAENFPNEEQVAEELYLGIEQIRALFKAKSLGLHSYGHLSLAGLDRSVLEHEVMVGKQVLESFVDGKIEAVSYPYGSVYDVDEEVVEVCKQSGLRLGFTMERAFNVSLTEPLLLARIDTNDAPGGKSPLFSLDLNGQVKIIGKMGEKRKLFIKE